MAIANRPQDLSPRFAPILSGSPPDSFVVNHHHVRRYRRDDVFRVCAVHRRAVARLFFTSSVSSFADHEPSTDSVSTLLPLDRCFSCQTKNKFFGGQEIDARRLPRLAPRLHIDPSRNRQSLRTSVPTDTNLTLFSLFPFPPLFRQFPVSVAVGGRVVPLCSVTLSPIWKKLWMVRERSLGSDDARRTISVLDTTE